MRAYGYIFKAHDIVGSIPEGVDHRRLEVRHPLSVLLILPHARAVVVALDQDLAAEVEIPSEVPLRFRGASTVLQLEYYLTQIQIPARISQLRARNLDLRLVGRRGDLDGEPALAGLVVEPDSALELCFYYAYGRVQLPVFGRGGSWRSPSLERAALRLLSVLRNPNLERVLGDLVGDGRALVLEPQNADQGSEHLLELGPVEANVCSLVCQILFIGRPLGSFAANQGPQYFVDVVVRGRIWEAVL